MLDFLDRPVFTVMGYHVTIGAILVALIVAWWLFNRKK